ncbi:unnamed protein product [Urochloa humidicola]
MDVGCGLVAETPLQLTQEVASRSSPPHEIAEVFIACQRIELSAPRTSMASPFPGAAPVIKVEDEERSGVSGLVPSEQELRDKFWKDVKRRVELKKRGLYASGSAQPPPPPPPPVQPPPLPLPPPPPAPPAHHPWTKRPATAASGVRGCSTAAAEAIPAQVTGAEGAGAAAPTGAAERPPPHPTGSSTSGERAKGAAARSGSATGAERVPRPGGASGAPVAPAKAQAGAEASGGGEEEADGGVRLLRRGVHDGVAPGAARKGAEAPEQGGPPRRGDERDVPRRAPLRRAQRPAALRREAAHLAAQPQRRSLKNARPHSTHLGGIGWFAVSATCLRACGSLYD